jgi:hypothetical protein
MLVAVLGDPDRFANGAAFKAYLGLTPRASETRETDRKGQPMSKTGNRELRTQLIRSAPKPPDTTTPDSPPSTTTRRSTRAPCTPRRCSVVAPKLAERAWTTSTEARPTNCVTATATSSTPPPPSRSSPSATPSPKTSVVGDGPRRVGRPLTTIRRARRARRGDLPTAQPRGRKHQASRPHLPSLTPRAT